MSNVNPNKWLENDSLVVGPLLLGWELISTAAGNTTAGTIVEVEAYHGTDDPASHAYRGKTKRTAPMFDVGGGIYVYFTYGMYNCVNIVTGPKSQGQAVLIRALEPTIGVEIMEQRRHNSNPLLLTSGPGRLTQALGITLDLSGSKLGETLSIEPPALAPNEANIISGPRIGISRATDNPWRFYLRNNPYVSKIKKSAK
jgi:DNA-3-methyladenine glycosylase